MGNSASSQNPNALQDDRNLYVKVLEYRTEKARGFSSNYTVFVFSIRHKRWSWIIVKRYGEFKEFYKKLVKSDIKGADNIKLPGSHFRLFGSLSERELQRRGEDLSIFLQALANLPEVFESSDLKLFLELGKTSLSPTLGRKGKAGYLKKCSGGYMVKGLSGGDGMFKNWRWRWIVAHDSCIAYHINDQSTEPEGILLIDCAFAVHCAGRYIHISSKTRRLTMYAPTPRIANEWATSLAEFYNFCPRSKPQPFEASFPPRRDVDDVLAFTCSRDYYHAVAVELLKAQEDILITAWKLSPSVILTRPPLPPIRLDQILKYKANQGVKIYILLYKEVEMSGQGNYSLRAKRYLESISDNIKCIRHPNKIFGSSTAILWSHHEKLVIIDRCTAFIGGLDLALNRYDDFEHSIVDEDGVKYPGLDYRQHATGLHRPVRVAAPRSSRKTEYEHKSEVIHPTEAIAATHYTSEVSFYDTATSDADDQSVAHSSSRRMYHEESMTESAAYTSTITLEGAREEGYGMPETEEEIAARASAGYFIEAIPYNELDVLEVDHKPHRSGFFDGVADFFGAIGEVLEDALGAMSTRETPEHDVANLREQYPRQAWHDVHAMVKGVPARDISLHFVQRWNYHRMSKRELDKRFLMDITDNALYSECARCELPDIPEAATECPRCHLKFGPCGTYAISPTISSSPNTVQRSTHGNTRLPDLPDSFSYIVFQCDFVDKIGCTLHGFGPVAVENVQDVPAIFIPGKLLHGQGEYAGCLENRGLYPSVGDIMLSVDGVGVGHLTYVELKRFIVRRFAALSQGQFLPIVFRRHFSQGAVTAYEAARAAGYADPEIRVSTMQYRPSSMHPVQSAAIAHSVIAQPISTPPAVSVTSPSKVDPASFSPVREVSPAITAPPQPESYYQETKNEEDIDPVAVNPYGSIHLPTVEPYASSRDIRQGPVEDEIPSLVEEDDYYMVPPIPTAAVSISEAKSSLTEVHDTVSGHHMLPVVDVASSTVSVTSEADEVTEELPTVAPPPPPPPPPLTIDSPVPAPSDTPLSISTDFPTSTTNLSEPLPWSPAEATDTIHSDSGVYTPVVVSASVQMLPDDDEDNPVESTGESHSVDTATENIRTRNIDAIDLPDAPTSLPDMLFPAVPTAALNRGRERNSEDENIDVAGRVVAMSGRDDPRRESSPPRAVSTTPVVATNLLPVGNAEANSYGSPHNVSPGVVNTAIAFPVVLDERSRSTGVRQSWTPTNSPRRSPLYIPDNDFTPGKREYTCIETIEIETRLSASSLVYEEFEMPGNFHPLPAHSTGTCEVQVLRSCGPWSVGGTVEHSIQDAWIDAIEKSRHLVYIENQFFIGSTETAGENQIQNRILSALLVRLIQAVKNKEEFRVIVVIPQHPSGDFLNMESPRIILNYEFLSICRGGRSLVESLVKEFPGLDPSQYIGFYCLRNWGVMNDKVVTEQIYVHDKVLIVDDIVAIIGSANMNDRSMLGDRDSEMAIRVVDSAIANITLGGKKWQAGIFPHMLRMNLMKAHAGESDSYSENLVDMALHGNGDDSYSLHWRRTATANSDIYNEMDGAASVYLCQSLNEYRAAIKAFHHPSYLDPIVRDMTASIKGYVVHWPMEFLRRDDLSPAMTTKAFIPLDLWM